MSTITLHDRAIWPLINKEWINLDEPLDYKKLSFCNQPLAFLLMYCDNAQEWGRAYIDPQNLSRTTEGIPIVMNLEVNRDRVLCELLYDSPSEETQKQTKEAYRLCDGFWTSLDPELEWELRSRDRTTKIEHVLFLRRV